ncbi:hypothetical protein GGR51DRAFT_374339 [Nemania sp. FL0031]|nr:hypothetical protein GGR51DRAFT_374339 [Nemania sp. FL0031]
MSFQFVDNSDINRKTRKIIRSHVMKGRNCGKVRIKRDRNPQPTTSRSIIAYRPENASNDDDASNTALGNPQSNSSIIAVARQLANDLTLLSSTSTIAPRTMLHLRQLAFFIIDVISPAEFCRYTRVTEWMWFQLIFSNKAYFHCNIAMASACAAFITGDESHSPVALHHMSQAYRLVNQQLSSDEALSDTTIAVVASINIYDRLYGDPQKALVHLNGVTRMIALRGGIRELAKRNFIIAEKAFRSDIELALHCRSKPKFCSDDVPRHSLLIDSNDCPQRRNREEDDFVKSILYQSACTELRDVVLDIFRFSHILDQASRERKLDPASYQSTLIYISYRLLEIKLPHQNSEAEDNFNNLIQLALIGFQNTFCFGIGRKLILFPLLIEQFRSTAQTISEHDRSRKMIVFWALLMGRVSSLTKGDGLWLIPKLKILAHELGLRTWPLVSNALRGFPWVKVAHEAQGEAFWNTTLAQPQLFNVCRTLGGCPS